VIFILFGALSNMSVHADEIFGYERLGKSSYCPKKDKALHSCYSDCLTISQTQNKLEYDMDNVWGL
jgi:hypothetical protein